MGCVGSMGAVGAVAAVVLGADGARPRAAIKPYRSQVGGVGYCGLVVHPKWVGSVTVSRLLWHVMARWEGSKVG